MTRWTVLCFAALLVFALGPLAARAQDGVLKDPNGPVAIQASIGPAFGLANFSTAQLKLSLEGLYHFGEDNQGFGIGGAFQMSFVEYVVLQFGLEARYAIRVIEGFAVAPLAIIGLGLGIFDQSTQAAFNIGFGLEARVSFGPGFVFARPIQLDVFVGEDAGLRWDLLFGGGASF
jgi:hypothetical protein